MIAEKNVKQWDVYLTWDEILAKLGISKGTIYKFYNQGKVRYVFRKMPRCGELCELIHFNLDDLRENIKKDWYEK